MDFGVRQPWVRMQTVIPTGDLGCKSLSYVSISFKFYSGVGVRECQKCWLTGSPVVVVVKLRCSLRLELRTPCMFH